MRWLSRLVTVGIVAAVAAVIVVAFVRVVRPSHVDGTFRTYALFRDASGLPVGSRVLIAGVTVGHIESLSIEGNVARVAMRVAHDVVIWDDGSATKTADSALGDNYIEISPGGPDPTDPADASRVRRRLVSGEPIAQVVEASNTDTVMRSIDQGLPKLDESLVAANAFLAEGREWVSGSFRERIEAVDRRLAAGAIATPLASVAQQVAAFDGWTADVARAVAQATPELERRLRDWPIAIARVTEDVRAARGEISETLGSAQTGLDKVDPYLDDVAEWMETLNDPSPSPPGRLGRLIHDPEAGNSIAETVADVQSFTRTINRLKTTIGFRTEQNILARQPRFYVTAEVAARNDQFYLIEAEKGPTGDNPGVSLTELGNSPEFLRTGLIPEKLRFTAQWGRRFGRFAVRLGVKESQFGAGGDFLLDRGRLKLSVDAMESSFSRAPRIKVAAALAVFRSLYILGGIDDAFTPGQYLPVQGWNQETHPTQFAELRYGRDYFAGFELRVHDADINRMLLIYGGLIAAMVSN